MSDSKYLIFLRIEQLHTNISCYFLYIRCVKTIVISNVEYNQELLILLNILLYQMDKEADL